MSVVESKRSPGKLEVIVKAECLVVYTIKICSNEKTFPPQYRNGLICKIEAAALDIYTDCRAANNIMVGGDPEKMKERSRLQKRAADNCNSLLAMISVAEKVCHLRRRRVEYWGGLVIKVRALIKAWRESNEKQYREQLKQKT